MTKKRVKLFEYDGLGFPILLVNIPVRNVRGVIVPDINYNELQRQVLLALSRKNLPFTGNEIRFIRQYFEKTLTEFAHQFGVTHPTVLHWEKSKDTFAKITPTTELCIRLYILDSLKADDKLFRKAFRGFDFYKFSEEIKSKRKHRGVESPLRLTSLSRHRHKIAF